MLYRAPPLLRLLYPNLIWEIPTTDKVLFLTFDDGPVPGPTDFVLDTLAQFNAKATFFCIGDNIAKYPRQFEQVIAQGHTIGNHTFNHLNGWKQTVDVYRENVEQCNGLMNGNRLFRPPYGKIKRAQIRDLSDYHIIMWDVLTHDYSAGTPAETILKRSVAATRPGSIVVFHDSVKAERNLREVLPSFMKHFSGSGFTFRALTNEMFARR